MLRPKVSPNGHNSSRGGKFSRPGTRTRKYLRRKNDASSPQPNYLSPVETPLFNTLHGKDSGAKTDRAGMKDTDDILTSLAIISPRYVNGSRSAIRNRNKK